jgi:hypothetical protein
MVGPDMTLQGLMFAEGLAAGRILCASKAFMAVMCGLVSSQSCSCQEAFCASFPAALMVSFVRVGAFDMLLQVLFFHVRLIASFVGAVERTFIGMRSDMGC